MSRTSINFAKINLERERGKWKKNVTPIMPTIDWKRGYRESEKSTFKGQFFNYLYGLDMKSHFEMQMRYFILFVGALTTTPN